MKKPTKYFSLIMILILILTGCSTKEQEGITNIKKEQDVEIKVEKDKNSEPITLNLEGGDWGYLSPYTHYSRGPGSYKMKLIFDSMLERGEEGLIPWLAESWDIDETGTDYIFKIRKGINWHDGEPMTAEDIKFSFEYYAKHPPVSDELNLSKNNYIKEINIIDEDIINIKVESPDATLLERFGMSRIIPKHIWEKVDDPIKFDLPEAVIGCGPYILKDYNKEQGAYKLEAFEDYWGPKQKANIIRFIPVSDNILAFENGDIDITGITPDILSKYKDNPKYKVIENPAFWGYKLAFNMEKRPELKNKELRQAIAYAIDKEELIEKVARGAAKPASPGYLPVEHVLYNKDIQQYDFDLEKSKELLNGNSYDFTLLTGNSNAEVRIGELIKINLEKVGINVDVQSLDSKSRDGAIKNGDYELALNGHGGWGNDADILRRQYAQISTGPTFSSGIPGYSNEEINKLCEKQLIEIDEEKRKEIIFQLQFLIAEEIPQIPLYNTSGYTVYLPEKYDGWKHVFNHHEVTHNKISYLQMD